MLIVITGQVPNPYMHPRRTLAYQFLSDEASREEKELFFLKPNHSMNGQNRSKFWMLSGQENLAIDDHSLQALHPVFYDFMYLSDLRLARSSYRDLLQDIRSRNFPLFNPEMPGKEKIFRFLSESAPLSEQLPMTIFDVTPKKVLRLLKDMPELWLKPVRGSGGRNSVFVQYLGHDDFHIVTEHFCGQQMDSMVNRYQLESLLRLAVQERRYLAQAHVPLLKTENQCTADLRITLVRNRQGDWEVVASTGRTSRAHSLFTNYHAGGKAVSLTYPSTEAKVWLQSVGMTLDDVYRAQQFASHVAQRLQTNLPHLGVLGMDIGQTKSGSQYVYDCNGRPGRDILNDLELERYMRSVVGFACWLQENFYSEASQNNAQSSRILMAFKRDSQDCLRIEKL
ncbi:hypothetical protein FY534_09395 [Alicyclobacillus sp. TC]|uniref:YheC/YheD family protein n=1 Tax=Alicyclobacillus sp. TC TaxID=2606450 RepID=UPI0019316B96|nr:YheC/YheD family protein [Alicyclobacillus sp. TC]QRF23850.1 hypothetical protein FY534_09395 [Alicyclobacillus sp. TC]